MMGDGGCNSQLKDVESVLLFLQKLPQTSKDIRDVPKSLDCDVFLDKYHGLALFFRVIH